LLSGLRTESVERLDGARTSHRHQRGQILHYEGNRCTGVHVIESGRTKLVRATPSGRHCILRIANPGDLLGLDAVFAPDRCYATTAEMLEPGVVSFVECEVLLEVIRADPSAAEAVAAVLGAWVRDSDEERVKLVASGVRERTARVLVRFARNHGTDAGRGVLIRPKLTREEIAEMVGSAAETVTRQLAEFRDSGLVRLDGRRIVVTDVERLSRIAHLEETPDS
jgi:CRP/FNR family transcriptional regulator